MRIKKNYSFSCLVILFLFFTDLALAQSLSLNWLFKPGMRFTTSFVPKMKVQDTVNFGMMHFNTSFIIPVNGKAEASLREMNLRASQTFITANIGTRFLQTEVIGFQKLVHNFSLGVTHIQADMKNGIWFYTANIGFVESPETFEKIKPFMIGAAARIVVKGLSTYNIYGLGITYNYDRIIPIPLFGINRQVADNWKFGMILPAYAELTYIVSEDVQVALRSDFSIFRTGVLPPISRAQSKEKTSLQYRDVRLGFSMRYEPNSSLRLFAQAGVAGFRSLRLYDGEAISRAFVPPFAPFLNLSLHINFGNAPIGSQLFGNDF